MIMSKFYYKVKTLIPNITQLPINGLINELMNSSNYSINIQFINIFQLVLMFVTNYYQRNVINCMLCVVILIPKHSFCNTVCVCIVMQIKLLVVVVVVIYPRRAQA